MRGLFLRTLAGVLLGIWTILALGMNKGGFVHILLLTGITVAVIEVVCVYRQSTEK